MKKEEGVICDFSMFPLDKGDSLSHYVGKSLKIIAESGLAYRLGPMSTAIEGNYEECMKIVEKCFEEMSRECNRIVLNLKMDFRRNRKNSMDSKIRSVERATGLVLNNKE